MTIFVTGDTHGTLDLGKLMDPSVDDRLAGSYLIIAGDFGALWSAEPDARENEILAWYDERPYTTLFIDGNHENHDRLTSLPVARMFGGDVHLVSDKVIHLMRGQVYEIEGKKIFCMGGASSVDRAYRIEGVSWWPAEMPSDEERATALANLDACGWDVDYVITHAAPTMPAMGALRSCSASYIPDDHSMWLQYVATELSYKRWYFGHYHTDVTLGRYRALYDDIVEIGD